MPTINVVAELTVDDLVNAVAKLDELDLAEFEVRFEQLWLTHKPPADEEAAQIAAKRRLTPRRQACLRTLLEKNREEGLTEAETQELDTFMAEMDKALEETADEFLKLAESRRQKQISMKP